MCLFRSAASLQPPRLSDNHLLQPLSKLISFLPFLDSACNQPSLDVLLHERHKLLLQEIWSTWKQPQLSVLIRPRHTGQVPAGILNEKQRFTVSGIKLSRTSPVVCVLAAIKSLFIHYNQTLVKSFSFSEGINYSKKGALRLPGQLQPFENQADPRQKTNPPNLSNQPCLLFLRQGTTAELISVAHRRSTSSTPTPPCRTPCPQPATLGVFSSSSLCRKMQSFHHGLPFCFLPFHAQTLH